jgi:predicted hydrolase (HD superfamily)
LRKHARAEEASMTAYAGRFGEDAERWAIAGMLHDFDYEMHPHAPHHPMKGAEILAARGVPSDVVYAILAHADYSGMPRRALLDRALYPCDELTGFVHACALVRPGRVITGLEAASVKKKLKDTRRLRAPSIATTSIAAPKSSASSSTRTSRSSCRRWPASPPRSA